MRGAFGRRGTAHPVWARRRSRAARLRDEHPHAAEMLAFYEDVLALQEPLYARTLKSRRAGAVEAAGGAPRLRLAALADRRRERDFARFLRAVPASAPEALKAAAARLAAEPAAASEALRAVLAREPPADAAVRLDADPAALEFFPRAFLQPLAEALVTRSLRDGGGDGRGDRAGGVSGPSPLPPAPGGGGDRAGGVSGPPPSSPAPGGAEDGRGDRAGGVSGPSPRSPAPGDADGDGRGDRGDGLPGGGGDRAGGVSEGGADRADGLSGGGDARAACPYCGAAPLAAVLRDEPEVKGRRTLLCSLCLTEWTFPRTRCPACAEERAEKRPHHVAESWPHVRLEECGSCRTYVKAIDLRETGLAVPVVDELASVELDLWAVEQGLAKLRTNLLGM